METTDPILASVWENSVPNRVYWLMNGLATVIACYGLFANSAAAVIGAMVVAMMLGPISGVALGLNEDNRALLRIALVSLTGGILWILIISVLIGLIHRDVPLTDEIMLRTDPTLFDLIIALAGGAAGAVAVVSPRVGTAIVGVAVATALVPPLAASGILLARADYALSGGALLLALTNIVAIELAFSTIFWIGGYRALTAIGKDGLWHFMRRSLVSFVLVGGLTVMLGIQLERVISRALFESQAEAVLRRNFGPAQGFYVAAVRFDNEPNGTLITTLVRGSQAPSAGEVAATQSDLPSVPNGSRPALRVRFIQVVVMTPQGPDIERGRAKAIGKQCSRARLACP